MCIRHKKFRKKLKKFVNIQNNNVGHIEEMKILSEESTSQVDEDQEEDYNFEDTNVYGNWSEFVVHRTMHFWITLLNLFYKGSPQAQLAPLMVKKWRFTPFLVIYISYKHKIYRLCYLQFSKLN